MVRVAPEGAQALLTGAFDARTLSELSAGVATGALMTACEALQENVNSMKDSRDKRVKAELCLVKLAAALSGAAVEDAGEAPAVKAPPRQTAPAPKPVPPQAETEGPPPWEDEDAPPVPGQEPPPAPPWEEPDAPVTGKPESAPVEKAAPEQKPTPVEREAPPEKAAPARQDAPAGKPAARTPEAGEDWWSRVLDICVTKLDEAEARPLSGRDNVAARLSGTKLTLYVRNMFVQMVVDVPSVRDAVAEAAEQVLGQKVGVAVEIGTPPEGPSASRKPGLDDLKKFDGIVKFT